MNSVVKTGIELTSVFILILVCQYIKYKLPHFSMHFFDGISKLGFNSFDFESKCKKHSKKDIERFKKKQRIILIVMLILAVGIMGFYLVSHS